MDLLQLFLCFGWCDWLFSSSLSLSKNFKYIKTESTDVMISYNVSGLSLSIDEDEIKKFRFKSFFPLTKLSRHSHKI